VQKLLKNTEFTVHRNEYCFKPISQQRKRPRVYLFPNLAVIICQINMSTVRSFEPDHMFFLNLFSLSIKSCHFSLLNSPYSINLSHLSSPNMVQYFLAFHFFKIMHHYDFSECLDSRVLQIPLYFVKISLI